MSISFASLLVLTVVVVATPVYRDSLIGLGLLGSHFGVPGLPASFDYIVVGGGTAGLTIARRLASNSSISVAVVEAGDLFEFSNGNFSQVPAYASYFTGSDPIIKNPYLDWYMYTEPQEQLGGRSILYDSGKILSGSSGRNFLWQMRGSTGCFRKWADEVGDSSYTLENMMPYFTKTYKYSPPDNDKRPSNSSAEHSEEHWDTSGGPMYVSYPSWVNSVSSWLRLAFEAQGMPSIPSFYGGQLLGNSWMANTLRPDTQSRSSASDFLRDALMETTNLIIYKSTLAKRILFKDGNQASGVTVNSGGVEYILTARREVIVSAGVMRSPQLLMVSGIGDRRLLEELNITLIADRPGVGQNMGDNVLVGPTFQVDLVTHSSLSNPSYLLTAIEKYNKKRTGILTNVGGDIAAFEKVPRHMISESTLKSLEDSFPADWPNLQYLILDAYFGNGNDSNPTVGDGKQYVAASVGLVSTFSRGNVSISSPNTAINPVISPNWLLDKRDQELAIAAFRRGRQLFQVEAMKPIVITEAYPGNAIESDAEILDIIRESANPVYNAVGTNKMGKLNDTMAVVNSNAQVFGVRGLRVVDASIFPFLPPGQPSATVYALAEKIADHIKLGQGCN
ncbi:glucose-methanol-choline oxidoreductase [Stachybotrys elegans]|uniref:Glucose-methanol-choline oxidoreductase n=1 Tax=Stachybotrys elegans TaxID=80388 RepID=A0A8K0WLC1_9HYPO|nr:glucose-methanol-choline oxidoreductase [Stachybotrys elegans]